MKTKEVLIEVQNERNLQDLKWGEQNWEPFTWLSILGEEVGECHKAALDGTFEGKGFEHLRLELIQTAAVAVAIIESLDRNELKP